jgi:zinc D-Ala-D-Ala carboxypeptidase
MTYHESARRTTRRIPRILVAGLIVVAAITAGLGFARLASSSTAPSPTDVIRSDKPGAVGEAHDAVPDGPIVLRTDHRGALGKADGVVPDGATAFDEEIPGVANLDPDLLGALRRAATDAAEDGVEFFVVSGWRSSAYQNRILRQAVSKYGSKKDAARWVATADTSPHVSGDAVDIGPFDAMAWLSEHGARHGLCQIYRNEPWHFELRAGAIDHGCPRLYADATHDPRMQQ